MRQPTRPGDDRPEPAPGSPDGEGPAAPESPSRPEPLVPLAELQSQAHELSAELRSRTGELSTELKSRASGLSTELQSRVGELKVELRSRLDELSTTLQSTADELEEADSGRRRYGLEMLWGKPGPGDPGRPRHRLYFSWGKPRGYEYRHRPVMPGLRIAVTVLGLAVAVIGAAVASVIGVGLPLLDALLRRARILADRQRGRLPGAPIPSPYPAFPPRRMARLAVAARDPATWRDLAWHMVFGITGTAFAIVLLIGWIFVMVWMLTPALVAFTDLQVSFQGRIVTDQAAAWRLAGLGLLLALGVYIVQRLFPRIEIRMSRALLTPALSRRVERLTATRADAVDMQAAELARIERDLHDGAQARLVALTLNLGLAEQMIASDPQAAQNLVAEARTAAGTALGELRDVIRGIHPPLLADRGLAGGLEALALASPLPVVLMVELPVRPPPALESALYFTAAELLTNAARHSGATRIRLSVCLRDGAFRVHIEDDGCGGAQLRDGGGLGGLVRRLAAFDGELVIDSPPDGGTRVDVMVPCAP
ncbi:MAG TPA: sensor domain-containing protein [Candidatus Limnocylindrales bacterium]|nr:sensor domain-containing protein [Candidatus Limnocylindrales bacterium]